MVAMVTLPGGRFRMGSDVHYREEAPAHDVIVSAFSIDPTPVTNRQFAAFVAATGYVTVAEVSPDADDYPGADPSMLVAASLVFVPTPGPVRLDDWSQWWAWTPGANWRHPTGPASSLDGLDDHPVVHVAAADAEAFAAWAGKTLPTEAEWEYAAWGGSAGAEFAWGDELMPSARTWPTSGKANFRMATRLATGGCARRPWVPFRPTALGFTT